MTTQCYFLQTTSIEVCTLRPERETNERWKPVSDKSVASSANPSVKKSAAISAAIFYFIIFYLFFIYLSYFYFLKSVYTTEKLGMDP